MGYFIKHSSVVTLRRRKHMRRPGSVGKAPRSIDVLLIYLHFDCDLSGN